MGSLFSSPSPPPPAPVIVTPDPVDEERKARLKALERRRRGRAGLVATSAKGLEDVSDDTLGGASTQDSGGGASATPAPKTKLGA